MSGQPKMQTVSEYAPSAKVPIGTSPEKRDCQRRASNPEKIKEYYKQWLVNNPGKDRAATQRRRALKRGSIVEKFIDAEIFERDKWVCQLCKKKVKENVKYPDPLSPSLDHIVPLFQGGPHTRENVQLAHLVCNLRAATGGVKQLRLFG